MQIKVFEMDECNWVAAATLEEAIDYYCAHVVDGEDDLCANAKESARELTPEEMDRLKHLGDDAHRREWPHADCPSFADELKEMMTAGDTFPCLFATTEI